MFNIWPYLLRLSVSFYFIYPHAESLLAGVKKAKIAVFGCLNEYIPQTIAFTLWHTMFVLLGLLILIWPRPILPLIFALIVLSTELYVNFSTHSYTVSNMLIFILVLVSLALIIYHASNNYTR